MSTNFKPELVGEGDSFMIDFDIYFDDKLYKCSIGLPINNRVIIVYSKIQNCLFLFAPTNLQYLAERTGKDTASKLDILDGMRSKDISKENRKMTLYYRVNFNGETKHIPFDKCGVFGITPV